MKLSSWRHVAFTSLFVAAGIPAGAGCGVGELDAVQNEELVGADEDVAAVESSLSGSFAVGTRLQTTTALNMRTGPGTGYAIITVLPQGAVVTLAASSPSGSWYKINYQTKVGWAHGNYLVKAATTTSPSTVKVIGGPVLSHVQSFANLACSQATCQSVGTRDGHHPTRTRAIDLMVSPIGTITSSGNIAGDTIASLALSKGSTYRVYYVIWKQRINSLDGRGWRTMENRGSITQNHYDHVHGAFDP